MEWQPIETAPRDGTPIVGWCVHDANPYHDSAARLTDYGAHCEILGCHAFDGPHVLIWGGDFADYDEIRDQPYHIPAWWFVSDTDFETVANPTHWMPLPEPPK